MLDFLFGKKDKQADKAEKLNEIYEKLCREYKVDEISKERKEYLTSDGGDVNISIKNGSLYNAGVAKTLIAAKNGGNLNIHVEDGTIGKEVGPCKDGVCTGIGPEARDLTQSINANIDGTYTAETVKNNKTGNLVINLAALDSDMNVNQIKADGRVILLADSSVKGQTPSKESPQEEIKTLYNSNKTLKIIKMTDVINVLFEYHKDICQLSKLVFDKIEF